MIYLDVAEITNVTVGIAGSTVLLASRVEVRTDCFTVSAKSLAFVHVHAVQAWLQTMDSTADLHRAGGRSLLEHNLTADVTALQVDDSPTRSLDGLASHRHNHCTDPR